MRRILLDSFFLLSIFGLLSCNVRFEDETNAPVDYIIHASCSGETKTTSDGLNSAWEDGDSMTAFYSCGGQSGYGRFYFDSDDAFSGKLPAMTGTCSWHAVYPYVVSNTKANNVKVVLDPKPVQNGNDDACHLSGPSIPLYGSAVAEDGEEPFLLMRHAASVIRFVVTNKEAAPLVIKKIIFGAPVKICGSFTADISAQNISWTPVNGESYNSISLEVKDGSQIVNGESASFSVPCIPFDTNGTFSIKVIAESGGKTIVSEREFSMRMAFAAGQIKKVNYSFKKTSDYQTSQKAYYVKVNSIPSSAADNGQYLVVSTDGKHALSPLSSSSSHCVGVTVTDNRIESTPSIDKHALTFTYCGKMHPNDNSRYAFDLMNSDGSYLYCTSGNFAFSATRPQYSHYFTNESSGIGMVSLGEKSSSAGYPHYLEYSSNNFKYLDDDPRSISLYRLVEGSGNKLQTLSFTNESVTWIADEEDEDAYHCGVTYLMPQMVSGANTDVTYTSSNNSVVEVVGSSWLKINKPGVAIITATAEADDEYASSSASYTIIIKESGVFCLEDDKVSAFLDKAAIEYTDENWRTVSVVTQFIDGKRHDIPKPVSLSWTGYSTDTKTVSVYKDAEKTELETSVKVASGKSAADIYNLIPGKKYYYTVSSSSNQEITSGTFKTTGRRRYIKVSDVNDRDHANNCRDLGGMKTVDGRSLKYGLVYRGSNMSKTTSEEQKILLDYMKIKADIDLRYKENSKEGWSANKVFPETQVYYSYAGYDGWDGNNGLITPSKIKKTFTDIINYVTQGKAIYIHCFIGADRTGYICTLLEAVCGVSQEDCTIDYELTTFCPAVGTRARSGEGNEYYTQGMTYIEGYITEGNPTFQEKAIKILRDAGITEQQVNSLINALVE